MRVTVTPGVSQSPRSLPLAAARHGLELDVALAPCVREGAGSRGGELLLLPSDSSLIFCRHSSAVAAGMKPEWEKRKVRKVEARARAHTHDRHVQQHTDTHERRQKELFSECTQAKRVHNNKCTQGRLAQNRHLV